MDKIAVCAIFKDEAPYLLEWIAFHRMIGVDLFVLYDNGSTDGGADLIRRSSFARNVTLIEWTDRPGQISAYRHFHASHAGNFTWVAFIDLDEFIMPVSGNSIRDILLRRVYEPYADILLNWQIFGPSGHTTRPPGLVIENFTLRFPADAEANRHVKSLVRTKDLIGIGSTPHIFDCARPTCNARGETVMSHAMQPAVCHDVMVINHYFTKSAEEWSFKRQRGRGDSLDPYGDRVFADVLGQATVEDTGALRFVPRLRALLGT
ncbi:MAG: glycosyltransferase family 2 protein [Acetobacteraceae bacterium]